SSGTFTGAIDDGEGTVALTKVSTGTLNLRSASTYSGGTTVAAGTLGALGTNGGGNDDALGSGPVTVQPGATLSISRMNVANDIYITDARISAQSGWAQEVFTGTITLGGSVILETGSQSGTRVTGNITGSGGLRINDTRTDNVTTLSGTNDYAGPTRIVGIAGFTNRVSFYNADTAQWTAEKLIVQAGSTAVFHVGGASEFTASDIQTLAALGSGTGGFASGSFICLDTSSANFTFDGVIENANSIGLAKYGNNTLTLSGASTHTGQTQIYGGAISVSSFNSVTTDPGLGTVHSASSNLGAPTTVDGGTILMGRNFYGSDTKLIYTGTGETTDRVIAFFPSGHDGRTQTIDQSGTGLLKFTSDMNANGRNNWTIVLQGAGDGEYAGAVLANSGTKVNNVVKNGTGTWALSGTNTYTGTTTVSQGTLLINGDSSAASGAVTVATAGRLGGEGVIGGEVTVNGTLAPGANIGTLTVGTDTATRSVAMAVNSTYEWQLGASAANKVIVTGDLAFSGAWTLKLLDEGGTPVGQYDLFTYEGFLSSYSDPTIDCSETDWAVDDVTITVASKRIYMTIGSSVVGDTDSNGVVDAADFTTLKKNFGTTTGAGVAQGNFTSPDGAVNWNDLSILTANMGAGGAGTPATTPEPATLFVMMAAGLPALLKRRRSRS
ncbi:MAG: hypothetical protein E4H19_15960, partial [Chromatiales bacterium]